MHLRLHTLYHVHYQHKRCKRCATLSVCIWLLNASCTLPVYSPANGCPGMHINHKFTEAHLASLAFGCCFCVMTYCTVDKQPTKQRNRNNTTNHYTLIFHSNVGPIAVVCAHSDRNVCTSTMHV